jgi:chorismate mutase
MAKKTQQPPNFYSPEREKRVAAALRENLRKRKLQKTGTLTKNDEKK